MRWASVWCCYLGVWTLFALFYAILYLFLCKTCLEFNSKISGKSDEHATFELVTATGRTSIYNNKVIYESKPHCTGDNHFSGCNVSDPAGGLGIGLTLTDRRDRMPKRTDAILSR